jgi:DNA-binding transcriptional ArsR family regulator
VEKINEDAEDLDKIKVFSSEDEKLKLLGELLSSKSSRDIIKLLSKKQMYTNEIATKLDMRVSLVIHHLKKMEELGLLKVTHKQIVKKGNNHRYFKMVPNLFVTPGETKKESEEKGILKKIFKESVKLSAVFLTAIMGFEFFKQKPPVVNDNVTDVTIDFGNNTVNIIPVEISTNTDIIWPVMISVIVISATLILIKKRKRWFNH